MKKFWTHIKNPLLTAAFVLVGMFLYVNFSYALPFGYHQSSNKDALFSADGVGEVTYVPDTALIYLGVNKTAATQEEAKNEANKVINKITEDLKKLGVEEKDIKTTNFSVNEDYSSPEVMTSDKLTVMPLRPTKATGFAANVSLEVRTKSIDKAEQVIDLATKDGATQVGSYQMILDETKQKELEGQARIEAIKNAKEKAKELSNAAGIRLGRVLSIQENGGGEYPRPMLMKADMSMQSLEAAAPTQLNPGENKISVTVSLSYETY